MSFFFDSHAHLSDQKEILAEAYIEKALKANVSKLINICTSISSLKKALSLKENYPSFLYNAASLTPHDVEKEESEETTQFFLQAAKEGHLVAIGETGLDYFHYAYSKELQKRFLVRYLHFCLEFNLPVIIHCREAFKDLFEILDVEYKKNGVLGPGVLHCFTGSLEEAKEVLNRGFFLSLSGIVTFKKSEDLREVARLTPLDQLLIETDAPYLAPQSKRGHLNESSFLPEVAVTIAKVKEIPLSDLSKTLFQNTCSLFLKVL